MAEALEGLLGTTTSPRFAKPAAGGCIPAPRSRRLALERRGDLKSSARFQASGFLYGMVRLLMATRPGGEAGCR